MRSIDDINVWKDSVEHIQDTSNSRYRHLFAGSSGYDEFARGKEQCGSFGLVNADGDGSKSFFVVGTVGDTAGYHVEVNFVMVGLDVYCGDHVVGSGAKKTENNCIRVPTHYASNRFTFEKFAHLLPLLHPSG